MPAIKKPAAQPAVKKTTKPVKQEPAPVVKRPVKKQPAPVVTQPEPVAEPVAPKRKIKKADNVATQVVPVETRKRTSKDTTWNQEIPTFYANCTADEREAMDKGEVVRRGNLMMRRVDHVEAKTRSKIADTKPAPVATKPAPRLFLNGNRNAYILVRRLMGDASFLTMIDGVIDIKTLTKDEVAELTAKDDTRPMRQLVAALIKSKLNKTPLAQAVLDEITSGEERDDYLTAAERKATQLGNTLNASGTAETKKATPPTKNSSLPATHFPLADILAEIGHKGTLVRAMLRKHTTKPAEGWAWPKADRAKIVAMIKGYFK